MVKLDDRLQGIRFFQAMGRQTPAEGVSLEVVGMRQVIDAGQEAGGELAAIVGNPAHGNAAETDAVVSPLAPDQLGARRIAAFAVVGKRDLERGVHRFGT